MSTFFHPGSSGPMLLLKLTISLFLCLPVVAPQLLQAQTAHSGQVVNEHHQPLAYATVRLLHARDSALVQGAISDANGRYVLPAVPAGSYLLSASLMGYTSQWLGPLALPDSGAAALPLLQLQQGEELLKAVTVVGKKPLVEQEADRMIVNVEGTILATGNSALEVLEKSPGVAIDQDGNISLNGKQGVIILLDGKRTHLSGADVANMLRNMPSDALEQVELITNPSAKYDAAGNSGIINLKTRKEKKGGTQGSLSLGAGQGRFEKATAGLSLNHRQGSLNLFGNYNWGLNHNFQEMDLDRTAHLGGQIHSFDHDNYRSGIWQGHSYKAGVDFFLNPRHTLGLMLSGNLGRQLSSTTNLALHAITGQGSERTISTLGDMDNGYQNNTLNLNYLRTFAQKGRELRLDLDYTDYRGHKDNYYDNRFSYFDVRADSLFLLRSASPADISIWVARLDYTLPLGKSKLELGAKSSYVYSNSQTQIERQENEGDWQLWHRFTNDFLYRENLNAAYASWSGSLGQYSLMAGLRAEHTWYQGTSVKNDSTAENGYISLFPSLFVRRPLSQKHMLGFSYSRRIDRPSYEDLNPFFSLLDVTTYSKGNPLLQPQFTHQLQLNHTYAKSIVTNFTYSVTDGPMTGVIETEGLDAFRTNRNLGVLRNWSLTLSLPVTIAKWWSLQNNFSAFHNQYKGSFQGQRLDVEQLSASASLQNSFKLSGAFSAELAGFYRSPRVWGTMRMSSMYAVNAGLQYSFWDSNASLKLSGSDLFRTQKFSARSLVGENTIYMQGQGDSRRLHLTFSYRFGNKELKPLNRKRGASSDEQDRIKGSEE